MNITPEERKVIKQACESFLYFNGKPWEKKEGNKFDVGMGAYHGAQACEVVGLFLMSRLKDIPNLSSVIYRDDVLGVTRSTPRQQEKMKQKIINIFAEHGLRITIFINLKVVNFLDVTFNLEKETYKPYRKPGDRPLYVNSESNHPPQIIRNIPKGIEQRLVQNSCSEEFFLEAIPDYQKELDRCGYRYKLSYNQPATNQLPGRRSRKSRRVTWFNPPYSLDVQTNVAAEFLKLVDEHFPLNHPLHSICNRTTIKVSYRCLPNMGCILAKHNSRILKQTATTQPKPKSNCNCQNRFKQSCPIPGKCNTNGVIYQATVTTDNGGLETYVGLAKNFKKRYGKHKSTILDQSADGQTRLSTHYWNEKNLGNNPKVSWKFLETNIPTFNPVSKQCKLCIREKFYIVLRPSLASLNSRQEIFAHCRHISSELLRPPD